MFVADRGRVGVIVERHELRSPEENDLRLRLEQQADRGAQGWRPVAGRPKRRVRPLTRADQSAERSAFDGKLNLSSGGAHRRIRSNRQYLRSNTYGRRRPWSDVRAGTFSGVSKPPPEPDVL